MTLYEHVIFKKTLKPFSFINFMSLLAYYQYAFLKDIIDIFYVDLKV